MKSRANYGRRITGRHYLCRKGKSCLLYWLPIIQYPRPHHRFSAKAQPAVSSALIIQKLRYYSLFSRVTPPSVACGYLRSVQIRDPVHHACSQRPWILETFPSHPLALRSLADQEQLTAGQSPILERCVTLHSSYTALHSHAGSAL